MHAQPTRKHVDYANSTLNRYKCLVNLDSQIRPRITCRKPDWTETQFLIAMMSPRKQQRRSESVVSRKSIDLKKRDDHVKMHQKHQDKKARLEANGGPVEGGQVDAWEKMLNSEDLPQKMVRHAWAHYGRAVQKLLDAAVGLEHLGGVVMLSIVPPATLRNGPQDTQFYKNVFLSVTNNHCPVEQIEQIFGKQVINQLFKNFDNYCDAAYHPPEGEEGEEVEYQLRAEDQPHTEDALHAEDMLHAEDALRAVGYEVHAERIGETESVRETENRRDKEGEEAEHPTLDGHETLELFETTNDYHNTIPPSGSAVTPTVLVPMLVPKELDSKELRVSECICDLCYVKPSNYCNRVCITSMEIEKPEWMFFECPQKYKASCPHMSKMEGNVMGALRSFLSHGYFHALGCEDITKFFEWFYDNVCHNNNRTEFKNKIGAFYAGNLYPICVRLLFYYGRDKQNLHEFLNSSKEHLDNEQASSSS